MFEKISETAVLPRRLDLVAIRQSKGITLDHITETTKITKRFLQAIEDYEFDKLPGGLFNTSYIRQYARAIDIGEEELLEYYYCIRGAGPEDGEGSKSQGKPTGKGRWFPVLSAWL